jgi:hypothetical protein
MTARYLAFDPELTDPLVDAIPPGKTALSALQLENFLLRLFFCLAVTVAKTGLGEGAGVGVSEAVGVGVGVGVWVGVGVAAGVPL